MDATLVGHNHAKTPLDIACWDIFGKSVGLPVYELLGGGTGTPMVMISSIHVGDPEKMRARVADHRARGYRGHPIKIGTPDSEGGPALDAERIAACLADRQPGEFFLVDANGGMTPESALRMLAMLPSGLDFVIEAPCATWRETMSLRQRDVARAAGLTVSVQDTVGSAIAFAGIAQLGATVPEKLLRCVLNCDDMVTLKTAEFNFVQRDGGILPPRGAGPWHHRQRRCPRQTHRRLGRLEGKSGGLPLRDSLESDELTRGGIRWLWRDASPGRRH